MAERVTDLRDIERRLVAHLVGAPEPGVSTPDAPVGAGRRGPRAGRHRRASTPRVVVALVTERGGPTSHTAIIARQLGIPCVVGVAGALAIAAGHPAARRRHRRVDRDRPGPRRRGAPGRRPAARSGPRWRPGPARPRPRTARRSSCWPTSPTASRRGPPPQGPCRASGCSAPSCASSTSTEEPSVEEQAEIYAAGARRLRRRPVRRHPHPRRRLRQADRLRHPRGRGEPRARRPRAAAVLRQPRAARAPARRHQARGRADRHRDLGDGADGGDRRRGDRLRRARCARAASSRA